MKLAIVGTSNMTDKIYTTLSREEDIELKIYEGEKISDIIMNSKEIDDSVDGIIFTGIGVYSLAVKNHDYRVPKIYTKRDVSSVAQVFFKLYKDYGDLSNLKIGIDTVREVDLLDFFEEYDIKIKNYKLRDYVYPEDEYDFIEKYMDQYKNNEIDCVVTASGYVHKYLKKEGIPAYTLTMSRSEIRESFNKLKGEIEKLKLDDKIALVQVFEIKDESYIGLTSKDKINLKSILYRYCKEIEGVINYVDDKELVILSSKKAILAEENIKCLSNIVKRSDREGVNLAIGIGEGDTISQAEDNARNAIRKSKLSENTSIFYYDGSKVVGPIFDEARLEYSTDLKKRHDELVEAIGISHQYIEKIDAVKKKLGRDDFTSKELSELLLISERTANRILKKIIESGYGEEAGYEVSLGAGRPRRKIRILF